MGRLSASSRSDRGVGGGRARHGGAAYDADHLRSFIADDLGATAQIKQNPSRATHQPIDWTLYKERHLIECFFNKIKRYRRIALRCEKTISAFRAFVSIACAMAWLA